MQENISPELIKDMYLKVNGELDIDWYEISTKHGLSMSSDSIRRAGVGIKLAAQAGVLDFSEREVEAPPPSISEKGTQERDAIYKAKRELYDQRREYNAILAKEARTEHLHGIIAEAANNLGNIKPLNIEKHFYDNPDDGEALVVLTDWHFGLVSDNIWNSFNIEILRDRVSTLVERTIEKIKRHQPRTLHVAILGDMIAGAIHASSRAASEEVTSAQLVHVSELLAEVIAELSNYVSFTFVYSTYGNHARTVSNIKDSLHSDNFEQIIPWWLKARFASRQDIEVVDSRYEFIHMDICGYTVVATHGDLDGGKNAPILINTMFEKVHGKGIDYFVTGHEHHIESFENVGIEHIKCGCLCGADDYANTKRLFSSVSQTLIFFSRTEGRECIYNIML